MNSNLRVSTLSAVSWSVYGNIINQGVALIAWIILARLLSPLDFGLITIVVITTSLLSIVRNMGLCEAIIYFKEIDLRSLSTVFYIHILIAAFISFCFIFSVIHFEFYSNNEEILKFYKILIADFFLGSFLLVPQAILTSRLEFKKLFIIEFVAAIISSSIAISFAYWGHGYMSLVYKIVVFTLIVLILSFWYSSWRPRPHFVLSKTVKLFKFGAPLIGTHTLNFLDRNVDDYLIGREFGPISLGLYNRSYAILLLPLGNLVGGISKVVFPAFTIIKSNIKLLRNKYLILLRYTAVITFPLMLILSILADDVVLVLLGLHWEAMIPIVRILAFLGLFQSISSLNGSMFRVLNRTFLQFRIKVITSILTIISIAIGVFVYGNILSVAICYSISSIIILFPILKVLGKLLNLQLIEILKALHIIFICSLLSGATLYFTEILFDFEMSFIFLILKCIIMLFSYLFFLRLFKEKALDELCALLLQNYKK